MDNRIDSFYSATDGLRILKHLDLVERMTDEEQVVFQAVWDTRYGDTGKRDLLLTVCMLYSDLPNYCPDLWDDPCRVSLERDDEINYRVEVTTIDEELDSGKPLDEILKTGPHTFRMYHIKDGKKYLLPD